MAWNVGSKHDKRRGRVKWIACWYNTWFGIMHTHQQYIAHLPAVNAAFMEYQ
jgi:hypothetical protein